MRATFENPDVNEYPLGFVRPKLKDAQSGDWAIVNYEVEKVPAHLGNLRSIRDGNPHRVISPGHYVKLSHKDDGVVMSDTHAEAWEHQEAMLATGKVLIAGLGIGFVLGSLLEKEEVTAIVVVEKSEDVIKLIGPYYQNHPKVTIIHSDIFDFDIDYSFDYAWFDIWPDICSDNLTEMAELTARADEFDIKSACWSLRQLAVVQETTMFEELFDVCLTDWIPEIERELVFNLEGDVFTYCTFR